MTSRPDSSPPYKASAKLSDDDLRRLAKWCDGYRDLMNGSLSATVHVACTRSSEVEPGLYAYLRIEDVETLLDAYVSGRQSAASAQTSAEDTDV